MTATMTLGEKLLFGSSGGAVRAWHRQGPAFPRLQFSVTESELARAGD